jgi:hypothetical protein
MIDEDSLQERKAAMLPHLDELLWNQHPEPNGSRRATPLLHFQQ